MLRSHHLTSRVKVFEILELEEVISFVEHPSDDVTGNYSRVDRLGISRHGMLLPVSSPPPIVGRPLFPAFLSGWGACVLSLALTITLLRSSRLALISD